MMEPKRFSVRSRLRSFVFACAGMKYFFFREHNAWIHCVAAVVVLVVSAFMKLSTMEWIAIVFAIAIVWLTEMVNTAIEKLLDHLSPAIHPAVKIVKDVSAAAVLTAAIAAVTVGLLIFIPKIL
jgi:diacylglycerol kinase (ATP)